jgi:molybdenum cofactor biosynthesis enzyme MoaA
MLDQQPATYLEVIKMATIGCKYLTGDEWVMNVKITSSCNGSCLFCFENIDDGYTPAGTASVDELVEISNGKLARYRIVSILGGEPLVYPYLWEYIMGIRSSKDKIYLTTNGILLPEKWKIASALDGINVSLHGYNEETAKSIMGSCPDFTELARAIRRIHENYKIKVRLNCNLHSSVFKSEDDIEEMIQTAKWLGADVLRFCELQDTSENDGFIRLEKFFPKGEIAKWPLRTGCVTSYLPENDGDSLRVEFKAVCELCSQFKFPDAAQDELVLKAAEILRFRRHNPQESNICVLYPDGATAPEWVYGEYGELLIRYEQALDALAEKEEELREAKKLLLKE